MLLIRTRYYGRLLVKRIRGCKAIQSRKKIVIILLMGWLQR